MLLYSKYSKHCIDLLNIITINEIAGFTNVCIDEPRIRDRILKSSTLKIRQVPCIISQDNQVYEGELAFRFVNSIIDAHGYHQQPPYSQPSNLNMPVNMAVNTVVNTVENTAPKKTYTSIEDIAYDEEDVQEKEPEGSNSYQDRYSNIHVGETASKSKKVSSRAAEIENERNAPPDKTSMRVSSLNDVGLDLSKGRSEPPIKSVKTGAPINVNKLMSAIESRS